MAQLCIRRHRFDAHVEREDLLQETMLALVPLINSKHIEPYTLYAAVDRAMRQALFELNRTKGLIRLNKDDAQILLRILRVKTSMELHMEREATPEEIAHEMRISVSYCKRLFEYRRFVNYLSLNGALMGDGSSETLLAEMVEDRSKYANPEKAAFAASLREQINKVLGTLDGLEETVARLRFGLYRSPKEYRTWDEMDQFEVADELKLLTADVRELEITAMRKLRHPSRSKLLEPYLAS